MRQHTVFMHLSGAETATGNTAEFGEFSGAEFAAFYLNISAASGTNPTLDVTIEEQDPNSLQWFVVATFTQETGVATQRQVVNPLHGAKLRGVFTIGGTTPSFTFSLTALAKADEPAGTAASLAARLLSR